MTRLKTAKKRLPFSFFGGRKNIFLRNVNVTGDILPPGFGLPARSFPESESSPEGVMSMPGVFLNEDDYNFDIALRRFKKQVEKAGVLSEMKKRQHYEKPSVMRKKKKAAARKRLMKKMRKVNMG